MLVKLDHFPRDRGENKKVKPDAPWRKYLPTFGGEIYGFHVGKYSIYKHKEKLKPPPSNID